MAADRVEWSPAVWLSSLFARVRFGKPKLAVRSRGGATGMGAIVRWLGQEGPSSPKHTDEWTHPLAACSLHYIAVISSTFALHDAVLEKYGPPGYGNHLCVPGGGVIAVSDFVLTYASILLAWRIVMSPWGSTSQRVVLYEYTWLCNTTLVVGAIALRTCRPIVANALCVAVGIDQVLWYADLVGWAISGFRNFPIGVSKYITWPNTSWATRVTCTHHLWTIPLLLFGSGGLHWSSYMLSIYVVVSHVLLSRWLTPFMVRETRVGKEGRRLVSDTCEKRTRDKENGKCGDLVGPICREPEKYLNVNLSHELWKDITFGFLQIGYDNPRVTIYLFRLLWRWQLFNLLVFFLLYLVSSAFLVPMPPLFV